MITLYDCAFSPFARKVRMVLEYKGLLFESIDGLHASHHAALAAINPRCEVPALVDGEIVVVNSSHIVAYLEDAYPEPSVLPADPALRVKAMKKPEFSGAGKESSGCLRRDFINGFSMKLSKAG